MIWLIFSKKLKQSPNFSSMRYEVYFVTSKSDLCPLNQCISPRGVMCNILVYWTMLWKESDGNVVLWLGPVICSLSGFFFVFFFFLGGGGGGGGGAHMFSYTMATNVPTRHCCNLYNTWVGVTQASFINFSLGNIFGVAKIPARFCAPPSYLTGAIIVAELLWHLSNVNVIFNRERFLIILR